MKISEIIAELENALDVTIEIHEGSNYDEFEIADIAKRYWQLRGLYEALDKQRKRLYHVVNSLEKGIFPAQLEKRDLDMVRVPELARSFYSQQKTSASILDKEKGYGWLRENGHGDLIQETVNAGTLASFARNLQIEEGIDLPEDLFKVTQYNTIGSSKYTPKKGA